MLTSDVLRAPQDECNSLRDVYVWGKVFCGNAVQTGSDTVIRSTGRTDILLPKPLESNLVLDVYQVDCGVTHAALVTKNGEVFTWGEDSGGRLGHGTWEDSVHPRLVESLTVSNVDFVACGEFHTCAVTTTGELYTWGDGTHNIGLLGHGNDVGHWIPKRISGALEGLQIAYVSCGTWHTALITCMGQLFTFGDGLFGVLGHGDRESVSYPREVESLSGLKTIAVACGPWHTAAIVDVIATRSSSSVKLSAGKLFTWGDGDKHPLGHGDKEHRLNPTCVAALIDHDLYRVACGHSITVASTTSGQVLSMDNTVYGQLGNPHSDGRLPCLVEDKIVGKQILQIACGSYHVAVLTSSSEVFTWGRGANGRLGHGDKKDRNVPTLVEALKYRAVRYITCGADFTAAICQYKRVSGADQSQCSSCRQSFRFTRKRHNCYNCGLAHCNACTSRKALGAALAPSPRKPYRVCDSCFLKLNNASDPNAANRRKDPVPYQPVEIDSNAEVGKASLPSNMDMIRSFDIIAARQRKKTDGSCLQKLNNASDPNAANRGKRPVPYQPVESNGKLNNASDPNAANSKLNNASDPNAANRGKDPVPYQSVESNSNGKVGEASFPSNMDMVRSLDIKAAREGKKIDGLSFLQNPQVNSLLELSDIASSGALGMNRSAPRAVHGSREVPAVMSLELLRTITSNFSEKQRLGSGTFGTVYKGVQSGKEIAVKLLHSMLQRLGFEEEFMKEFENLRRLKHPNIVQLLGYCYEIKRVCVEHEGRYVLADEIHRALCFEYMCNGSLQRHLDDEAHRLDWRTCHKIIKGTCEGLKYLHEAKMYHLDLKPGNILLDMNMVPKIADLGLSRLVCDNETQTTSSLLGTTRYCPPEYIDHKYVSNKFDVFSLGVVMIEIIAGPEGYCKSADMPSQEFINHVQENWRKRLQATAGCTSLIYECHQVKRCTEIALQCVSPDRRQRPSIGDITSWLNETENNAEKLATMTFTSQNKT